MKQMPSGLEPYKRTPEFTSESLPAALREAHRTKPGVWGKIVVL
jgi:tellurite methyltransferase